MKTLEAVFPSDSSTGKKMATLGNGSTGSMIRKLITGRQNHRSAIKIAYEEAKSAEDLYRIGMKNGLESCCLDLADVLYSLHHANLGRASVLQESNRHVILKVQGCAECSSEPAWCGCSYLAGFICGALLTTGRPKNLEVREESCGRTRDSECIFMASW